MNKVILIGYTSKDIELSTTTTGKTVGRFSLAVNRKYEQNGEKKTDFFNIVAWENLAANMHKYCKKGSKIAVIGELQQRTYEVNGEKRYTLDILANEIEFLNNKSEEQPKTDLIPVDDNVNLPF